jgi:hypothetical protein
MFFFTLCHVCVVLCASQQHLPTVGISTISSLCPLALYLFDLFDLFDLWLLHVKLAMCDV